jgi:uncharacterized membrane protein
VSPFFFLLTQVSILAYGLVGGVFLAFSDFVMRSLSLTGGAGGVEAMQVINREVFRRVFMALFLGLAAVSLVLAGYGATRLAHPSGAPILLAGLVYLIGCFGVTVAFSVPMNEALADMDPGQDATRAYWTGVYLPRWTFWNTVRTVACGLSAALLLFGLAWAAQARTARRKGRSGGLPGGDRRHPAPSSAHTGAVALTPPRPRSRACGRIPRAGAPRRGPTAGRPGR